MNLVAKFFLPQTIEITDDHYFIQEKGIPSGITIGPLLFATYLDHFLKTSEIDKYSIKAYGY